MEWVIVVVVAVVSAIGLPPAIIAAKKSVRGNGRMAGVALSIGLAFSILYDARKPEVIENIAKRENHDEELDQQDDP